MSPSAPTDCRPSFGVEPSAVAELTLKKRCDSVKTLDGASVKVEWVFTQGGSREAEHRQGIARESGHRRGRARELGQRILKRAQSERPTVHE